MTKLRGIARFEFHDGKVGVFKDLSAQCMKIVRENEPNTLQYDIYFNEDETSAVVYEEYVDSQALIDHFTNVSELMAPIMDTATVTGELLGEPCEDLRSMLTGEQPRLLLPYLMLHNG